MAALTLAGPSDGDKCESDQILMVPIIQNDTKEWIWDYLNLDAPISRWYDEWCQRDPIFAKHAKRFAGVSILRQDPWECMCASNNNIPRISQMVHKLSDHFTEPVLDHTYPPGSYLCTSMDPEEDRPPDTENEPLHVRYHPFPTPSQLAEPGVEQKLRSFGFGYRAKYLAGTAQSLCALATKSLATDDIKPVRVDQAVYDYLLSLRSMTYADARQVLLQLPGVGPKVADCILLMSLDQYSSIPVDRHVFQFAERWYRIRSKKYEDIADRLREIWGKRAGWAHTVLFYADLPSFDRYDGTKIQSDKATDVLSYKRERSPEDELAAPARDVKLRVPHRS
ncbi:DNA-(apurinic or apyrimidinic site) lyase [Malassezia nana]|uniref:DNA-(apurinic or apyrimidinic site) lyase n=1 Tax=Malassezia nana TaxID=180528 RepID=A0AAF0J1D4_9BASI|nr:DNA-(apurinic or apyrimidinic site) lyase [Malassezia nana]